MKTRNTYRNAIIAIFMIAVTLTLTTSAGLEMQRINIVDGTGGGGGGGGSGPQTQDAQAGPTDDYWSSQTYGYFFWNSSTHVAVPDTGFSSQLPLYTQGYDINFARYSENMPNMSAALVAQCNGWVCIAFSERAHGNYTGHWSYDYQVEDASGHWGQMRHGGDGTISAASGEPVVTGGDKFIGIPNTAGYTCWSIVATLQLKAGSSLFTDQQPISKGSTC